MRLNRWLIALWLIALGGCAAQYPNQAPIGRVFPAVSGAGLDGTPYRIPDAFTGRSVVLLIGYRQDSQFDIDRWLIGLDMTATRVDVYELPTIAGMFPRMFKTQIDDFDSDLGTNGKHFRWMFDPPRADVGDMQQTVYTAQVDEYTVIGNIFNNSIDNFAFMDG